MRAAAGIAAFVVMACVSCSQVEQHKGPAESDVVDDAANALEGKTQGELSEMLFSRPSADQRLTNFLEEVKLNVTPNQLQEWAIKVIKEHRPDRNTVSTNIPIASEAWPEFLEQLNNQNKIASVSVRYGDQNLLPYVAVICGSGDFFLGLFAGNSDFYLPDDRSLMQFRILQWQTGIYGVVGGK